ncbi:Guanylate kinase [uncultured Sporomusa sp.]|uniref:Guanylate kinase n=1 Tax=uncultured Sporomusa sp. TaxID=307249 RepID=A0A212LXK8_9FIRM|nr:guanylate kinase [uncultured Sporomusa sp.]SCM82323.1 Guanylate kinase [uncultured Sporomusa sp.]
MYSIIAFMGPSGSGKSTLQCTLGWKKIVTWTSRSPRNGEILSLAYNFTDVETLKQMEQDGKLLEMTLYNGNYYATDLQSFFEVLEKKSYASIIVDVNGAKKLKQMFPLDVLIVGVFAPIEDCKNRLLTRKDAYTDSRLKTYKDEVQNIHEFSDIIINNGIVQQVTSLQIVSLLKSSIIGMREYDR